MTEGPVPAPPAAFVRRLARILAPGDFADWQRAFTEPRPVHFRINPLLAPSPAVVLAALAEAGLRPRPLEGLPDAYGLSPGERERLVRSMPARAGWIYVQNPASMLPPLVLAPEPGEEILDLAAAPGSKTLQLCGLMGNRGRIAAVEVVRSRYHRLRANLERHGARCVQTYLADGRGVGRKTPERFDRVLLDAPCSSEGRFHAADPASWVCWSERKVREMAHKQRRLLWSAAQALRPGGWLVYATCTFAPEENEGAIQWLLDRAGGALEPEPVRCRLAGVRPGLTGWEGRTWSEVLRHGLRVLPRAGREAFFVCRLRKVQSLARSFACASGGGRGRARVPGRARGTRATSR